VAKSAARATAEAQAAYAAAAALTAIQIGIDLAKTRDYTAIAVAAVRERARQMTAVQIASANPASAGTESVYTVQLIDRLEHDLAYPVQIARIMELCVRLRERLLEVRRSVALHEPWLNTGPRLALPIPPISIYLDATGLGGPVSELLETALKDDPRTREMHLYPLVFMSGERFTRSGARAGEPGRIGKTYLIARVQALLATACLELPKQVPIAPELRREIDTYHVNIDASTGQETWGAAGPGSAHDDLVTALALAVVDDPRRRRVTYGPRLW